MGKPCILTPELQVTAFNVSAVMEAIASNVDRMLNGSRQPGEEHIVFGYAVVVILPEQISADREAIFAGSVDLDEAIAKLKNLAEHAIAINQIPGNC